MLSFVVSWHGTAVSTLLAKFHLEVGIHVNQELRIKNKKYNLCHWSFPDCTHNRLKSVLKAISSLTAGLWPLVWLHCIASFLCQYWQREAGQLSRLLSLAAAPVCCPALSSLTFLLMGLVVFLLAILTSSGKLVSISWLHVGDLASEIRTPAVPSDHGGGYEVPSSASFSIATSYLRHIFIQHAGCCSSCSVVQNSSQAWSEEFRPLSWGYE